MKKLLSILLSLLMVFSVMPMAMVSAEGEETEQTVVYQTIVDMSDYDGATLAQYDSPWFTKGLTRSYNIGKTSHAYDAETDSIKFTRGTYDPCGLYYFDDSLSLSFSDSLGFRVWIKGDADSGVDVTGDNNLHFLFDTVDAEGTHATYAAAWYSNSNYKVKVPAEGAWVEIKWADIAKNFRKVGSGMMQNRPSFSGSAAAVSMDSVLPIINGFCIGFKETGANKIYYVGDVQLIKPVVNVTVDGQVIAGYAGQEIKLPEPTTEGVIAYTDGDNLYYPGQKYVINGETTLTNIKNIIHSSSDHDFVFDLEDKVYTGKEICPAVTSATLTQGIDYEVSYRYNDKAGTAEINVSGLGENYISLTEYFKITKKPFEVSDFTVDDSALVYNGEKQVPIVTSDVFTEEDFSIACYNNIDAGEDTAILYISSTYLNGTGSLEIPFSISQKEITEDMFTVDTENKVFEGNEVYTDVVSDLVFSGDYVVGYSKNRDVGTATVFIEGMGNYCGRLDYTFEIVPKEIEESMFTVDTSAKTYTAEAIEPEVTSTLNENDYDVSYSDNVDAGTATITITGKGNYGGSLSYEFTINTKEIEEADFTVDTSDKHYTGLEFEDLVTSETLADDDYVVAYEDNRYAGLATITITGNGNCTGELTYTFNILKKVITEDEFTVDLEEKDYTSFEICPEVTTDLTSEDYTVAYTDNIDVGTATIIITGAGDNCEGEVEFEFEIVPKEIDEDDFSILDEQMIYSGEEFTPDIDTIFDEENYTVEYIDNVNAGEATVIITGKNNLIGEIELAFEIEAEEIVNYAGDSEIEYIETVYTGECLCPVVTIEGLVEGDDFELEYTDDIDVGVATVTITGIGNYKGEFIINYHIRAKDITKAEFTVDETAKVYTGDEITTEIVSDLVKETDYTVVYKNNVDAGVASVEIYGCGNYQGNLEYNFDITPKSLDAKDFVVNTASVVFTGEEFKPQVMSTMSEDCYEISYENNVNAGEGKVIITGKGNYKDTVTATFVIMPKTLTDEDFAVDKTLREYTGKEYTPEVATNLVKDVDYTLTYLNNKNVGTATIVITGIGNYAGEVTKEFAIVKPTVKKVKGVKVTSKKAKTLTVKWRKTKGVKGYVIQYSLKKNFKGKKTVYVKKQKTVQKLIKKLKSGKKYYVRVAAYKNYKNAEGKTLKVIGKYTKVKKAVTVK